MKLKTIIKKLNNAIPIEATWPKAMGEPYGGYNLGKLTDVHKILYCVTATPEVIAYFKKHNYDLLISHHPYIGGVPQLIYHTALDCCVGGLNDQWRDLLGLKNCTHIIDNLGWVGEMDTKFSSLPLIYLIEIIEKTTKQSVQSFKSSDNMTKRVAVCTGLGGLIQVEAYKTKADCFVMGEGTIYFNFKSYIEIGHTLSEQCGINLIRQILPKIHIDLAPVEYDIFNDKECKRFAK